MPAQPLHLVADLVGHLVGMYHFEVAQEGSAREFLTCWSKQTDILIAHDRSDRNLAHASPALRSHRC